MKTKDEIREKARQFLRYKRYFSFSDTAVISRGELIKYLTDFTHSQLKERQDEIEQLKAENERLEKLHGTGELGETLRIERKLVISELTNELTKTRREKAKLQKEVYELPKWVEFDFMKIESCPSKYGKYFVRRKDGKIHWETWNGSGWAYNGNVITHWIDIPKIEQLLQTNKE